MWVPFENFGQIFATPGLKLFKLTPSLLHVSSKTEDYKRYQIQIHTISANRLSNSNSLGKSGLQWSGTKCNQIQPFQPTSPKQLSMKIRNLRLRQWYYRNISDTHKFTTILVGSLPNMLKIQI